MDSKKLEALVVSVEQGSFTRAAELLGYTQSGLTHMMNSLEKDMGLTLLMRCRSGVKLTATGERLYPLIKECLQSHRRLEREVSYAATHGADTIHVAAYASIATHWLPEIIEQFRQICPGVSVDIQMGSVEEVYRWVLEDRVDMTFASYQPDERLAWTPLRDDPLLAILPKEYDLGGAASFDLRRFEDQEFLMPSLGFDLDILRVLNGCGVKPSIQPAQVSDSVVISMVEHGLGVSMLSELILRGRRDSVKAVPLEPPAVRELGIVSRPIRELHPMARDFIRFSRDMIQKM